MEVTDSNGLSIDDGIQNQISTMTNDKMADMNSEIKPLCIGEFRSEK